MTPMNDSHDGYLFDNDKSSSSCAATGVDPKIHVAHVPMFGNNALARPSRQGRESLPWTNPYLDVIVDVAIGSSIGSLQ